MSLPRVEFKPMSLEENIKTIVWSFYKENGFLSISEKTKQLFPDLKKYSINDDKEVVYNAIKETVTRNYYEQQDMINNEVKKYNDSWNKYNDIYFKELTNYFGVDFPVGLEKIIGRVGLIPVCPRYLDDCSFSVCTSISSDMIVEIVAHETLHFIWFEKWKKLHPETPKNHFDNPHFEWQYSEMVTDPILNNKPFNNIFYFTEKSYDEFYEYKDNDELVMDKLRDIYSTSDNIDNKMNNGYEYLKEYFNTDEKSIKK